ncbi:copper resistance CopC family protein [Nocardioides sp. WG-D5]|uniref:copper resistance CopC family protein n=1 Tax=Nocardioides luteus TaxID=1844 RepID=UPI0018C8EDE9|nr:copper resistance CopC family protein [Nocardioides luteus]MBG6098669.1 copper transport protein [Nocardioides luteus]
MLLTVLPSPTGDPVLVALSPKDGETVRSPDEVRITFDRPVPAELATVQMTDPAGERIVSTRPYNPPDADDTVAVPMPKTRYEGIYSVVWSVPSSALEPMVGSSTFSVFSAARLTAVPGLVVDRDPVVVTVYTVAGALATAALVLGVGTVFVLGVVWPEGIRRPGSRRLLGYTWATLVLATLVSLLSFGGYAARTSLGDAFDPALLAGTFKSDIGAALMARLLILVPITLGFWQLLRSAPARTPVERWTSAATVLGAASALAATWVFARPHAPAGPGPLTVAAGTALLLAAAVVVGVAVMQWTILRRAGGQAAPAKRLLAQIMPVGGAVLLLAATATGGWRLIAYGALAVVIFGTGVALLIRERRRRSDPVKSRGRRDKPARRRLQEVAAVSASATVVVLAALPGSALPG